MMLEPRCSRRGCVHFRGVLRGAEEASERVVCRAFPDGIPHEIAYGQDDHLRPFPGDHGVTFEEASRG